MDTEHRRLLTFLGLAVLFEGYGRQFVGVTLSYVGRDLGASADALSFALAVIAAGSLGVLVLGPLADRFGRRRVLLASIALFALFGAATASATSLAALIAWQLVARVAQEGALFTAAVLAAEEIPAERRATAQGVIGSANALGTGVVALFLAGIDHVPGGWRGLCLVSLVPLVLLPLLARSLPESRRWLAHSGASALWPPPAYRRRALVACIVVALAMSYDVAAFAFATYLPITLYGWSPGETSAMFIVAGGLGMPGWALGGILADRHGRRPVGALFLVGLTLAELLFFLGGPAALWPGFAAMVFFQGGKMTIIRACAAELFPTAIRGAAAGWLTAAATAGGMAGLALAGALTSWVGGIQYALAVIALAGVLAAGGLVLGLPETRGMDLDEAA